MTKAILLSLAAAATITASYYGSTELGLRTETWREVTIEASQRPSHERIGQNFFTPDGTRLVLCSIERGVGNHGGKFLVKAQVQVTERLALEVFEGRMARSYAMDLPAIERTMRQAVGVDAGRFEPSEKKWHPVM